MKKQVIENSISRLIEKIRIEEAKAQTEANHYRLGLIYGLKEAKKILEEESKN